MSDINQLKQNEVNARRALLQQQLKDLEKPAAEAGEEPESDQEKIIDRVIEWAGDSIERGEVSNRGNVNDLLGGSELLKTIIGDAVEEEFHARDEAVKAGEDPDDINFEPLWLSVAEKLRKLSLSDFEGWDNNLQDEDAEEAKEACTGKSDCPCPTCTKKRSKERERQIEVRYGNIDHLNDSVQITNFIKAISQKNYAVANKYLQGVVESKLKRSISKANNK